MWWKDNALHLEQQKFKEPVSAKSGGLHLHPAPGEGRSPAPGASPRGRIQVEMRRCRGGRWVSWQRPRASRTRCWERGARRAAPCWHPGAAQLETLKNKSQQNPPRAWQPLGPSGSYWKGFAQRQGWLRSSIYRRTRRRSGDTEPGHRILLPMPSGALRSCFLTRSIPGPAESPALMGSLLPSRGL